MSETDVETERKPDEGATGPGAEAGGEGGGNDAGAGSTVAAAGDKPKPPAEAAAEKPAGRKAAGAVKPQTEPTPAKPATLSAEQATALRAMGGHRYGLYKHGDSYGVDGPEHAASDVEALIGAGLAWRDETGGAHGSAKLTQAGLDALRSLGR